MSEFIFSYSGESPSTACLQEVLWDSSKSHRRRLSHDCIRIWFLMRKEIHFESKMIRILSHLRIFRSIRVFRSFNKLDSLTTVHIKPQFTSNRTTSDIGTTDNIVDTTIDSWVDFATSGIVLDNIKLTDLDFYCQWVSCNISLRLVTNDCMRTKLIKGNIYSLTDDKLFYWRHLNGPSWTNCDLLSGN